MTHEEAIGILAAERAQLAEKIGSMNGQLAGCTCFAPHEVVTTRLEIAMQRACALDLAMEALR